MKQFEIVPDERPEVKALKRLSDGTIINIGDTLTLSGTDIKGNQVENEFIILGFTYDEYGDLYFHTNKSFEHRTIIGLLENAINKTKQKIESAKQMFIKIGYNVTKKQ